MKQIMRLGIIGLLCLGVFLILPLGKGKVAAEEQPQANKESVFTLGEVEVTAQGEETKNVTVEAVPDEEMREFSRDSLGTALNLLPGVILSQSGNKNEQQVFIRGLTSIRVPLFIDGVPIYVPYDGSTDLSRFTTFDFSEIILSKGFTSVLYGPNTLGGAINVVTKRPEKPFEGNGGIGAFDGGWLGYANFGANQKKWYLQGGVSYTERDYFLLPDNYHPKKTPKAVSAANPQGHTEDGGQRENSDSSDLKYNVKFGFTPAEGHEYALSYWNQQGEKGIPPYAGTDANNSVRYWRFPKWDKEGVYFNSRTPIGDKSYIKTRAYYDTYQNSLFSYDDASYTTMKKKSSFKSDYKDYTVGGSAEFGTSLIPNNLLKFAVHYKDDVHREHNRPNPFQRFEDRTFSIGAEDTITFTKRFYAILGVSFDDFENIQAENWNVKPHVDFKDASNTAWNPQIGLFYSVTDTGKFSLTVSQKTRFPTMFERYSYRFGNSIPNEDLKPETARNYEIGYDDVLFKRIVVRSSLFYRDLTDFIDTVSVGGGIVQNQNQAHVEQYGFEIEANAPITSMLDAGFNYTYLDTNNRGSSLKIRDVPEHKLFTYAKFTPIKKLSILADLEIDSKRWSSTDGARLAKGFTLVNAKVMYEATKVFTIEGGVKNVFDKDWATDEGFPMWGRTFFGNLRYRF